MAKSSVWSVIFAVILFFFALPLHAEPINDFGAKVEIARIRSSVLPGVLIGGHYDGLLKIRQQRYVATDRLEEQLDTSVRDLLENELSDAGFDVLRSHSQSLFADLVESSEPGKFLIGGTITKVNLNSYSSFFKEYTHDDRKIRWELFDRDLSKVVYRQEIVGSAKAEGIDNPEATYEAIRASFRNLLADPRFVAILDQPVEEVPTQSYKIAAIAALPQSPTLEQLVGRTIPSIVQIRTPSGRGSGFLLDSSGLIMTNHHVVGSAFSVKVKLYDGSLVTGRVLRRDALTDAALVKLDEVNEVTGLPICDSDQVRVGQSVIAIGNPLSFSNSVTQGIVSGFRRNATRSLIQTDTAVNPGNSGGPLLNREGKVIGIVTEKIASEGIEGLGFALQIGDVLRRLNVSIDAPENSALDSCGNPLISYK
jgi:serine protease Do